MKQKIFTSGLVFLIILGVSLFTACKDDTTTNNNNDEKSALTGWPDDLPKFEHGTLISTLLDDETGKLKAATFANISNPETVYNSYRTALISSGWVLDVDTSTTWSGLGVMKKTPRVCMSLFKKMAQQHKYYIWLIEFDTDFAR